MMTKLGICSLLAGFCAGVFSGISKFMEARNFWVDLTLSKMIGEDRAERIVTLIDVEAVRNSLDYLMYDLPLFCFLLGLGVVFLLIGMFVEKH